jgi:hypothetical protein
MINFKQNTTAETSQFLRDLLKSGTYSVKFTKVDGSERTLRCTLRSDILPPAPVTEGTKRKSSPELISVWDTENSGWRSFKISNIISVDEI